MVKVPPLSSVNSSRITRASISIISSFCIFNLAVSKAADTYERLYPQKVWKKALSEAEDAEITYIEESRKLRELREKESERKRLEEEKTREEEMKKKR